MKKTILTLFAFTMLLQVNAQENETTVFAPIGAKWYYKIQLSAFAPDWYFRTFEAIKDTIIEGKKCVVLEQTEHYIKSPVFISGYEYLLVEEQKVYRWNKWNKEFDLLYNFSANAGDTWEIPCKDCDGTGIGNPTITMRVEEVSYIDYSGLRLKQLKVVTDMSLWFFGGTATERLGGDGYLFLFPYAHEDMFMPLFYCYSDNETKEPCEVALGISYTKEQAVLTVTNGYVQIPTSLQLKTDKALFYDLSGKIILSENIDNNRKISLFGLPVGICLLGIETKNEGVKTFKINVP